MKFASHFNLLTKSNQERGDGTFEKLAQTRPGYKEIQTLVRAFLTEIYSRKDC
jgi:hypothetical protein